MNAKQIQKYVMRYLEARGCHIIEKSPAHVIVKLSPEADKEMTNRSYYWNFVERTGVEAETMTYKFIFDPDKMNSEQPSQANQQQPAAAPPTDSILGRYFGHAPNTPPARLPTETVNYGSRRLDQIFHNVKSNGKYVLLFEEARSTQRTAPLSEAYSTWLGVNYKVELSCDMKRSEMHSLGIHLINGEIRGNFHEFISGKKLTPRLPSHIHLMRNKMSLHRAAATLESHIEQKIAMYDHSWAVAAHERLQEELARIESYYADLLLAADEEIRPEVEARYKNRQEEIAWQYRPRIQAAVTNCGLFHLHYGE